jgi:hypothetical protein
MHLCLALVAALCFSCGNDQRTDSPAYRHLPPFSSEVFPGTQFDLQVDLRDQKVQLILRVRGDDVQNLFRMQRTLVLPYPLSVHLYDAHGFRIWKGSFELRELQPIPDQPEKTPIELLYRGEPIADAITRARYADIASFDVVLPGSP